MSNDEEWSRAENGPKEKDPKPLVRERKQKNSDPNHGRDDNDGTQGRGREYQGDVERVWRDLTGLNS